MYSTLEIVVSYVVTGQFRFLFSISLGNKFLFISFFSIFYVFGIADADFDVTFCIVSTVSKIFATD